MEINAQKLIENLGKTVIKLRKSQGISQEDFARKSMITRHYMSDIENGKRQLSIPLLVKIANGLEISVSDLFAHAESEIDNT